MPISGCYFFDRFFGSGGVIAISGGVDFENPNSGGRDLDAPNSGGTDFEALISTGDSIG